MATKHTNDCQCDTCQWASVEELVDAEIEADLRAPYRDDFPDFDPETMPHIPDGFEDVSFHNDICPHFVSDPLELEIWVDYLDKDKREFPDWPRFRVSPQRAGTEIEGESLETDNWEEVVAFVDRVRARKQENANG